MGAGPVAVVSWLLSPCVLHGSGLFTGKMSWKKTEPWNLWEELMVRLAWKQNELEDSLKHSF